MKIFLQGKSTYKAVNKGIASRSIAKKCLISFVLLSISLMLIPISQPVFAQRIVTVTADQPNIWTLEQAHYLLAQMHRRNLDLKAKGLNPLDANEINGINIDILKSILEIGAAFNEADQFNNNLTKQDKTFIAERRRQLTTDIDELNKEKLELTRLIARLKRERETATNDDEKAKIDAKILENTEIKAEVEAQIAAKTQQLNALGSANGNVTGTNSGATFNAGKFPPGIIDTEIKNKLQEVFGSYVANPKLNASLQLDKFVQLQYEIISKQLTLLRDEIGPGERLLFLELPQSINANYDKSDDMWAQSRWKISGFNRCVVKINNNPVACHKILYPGGIYRERNRLPRTTLDIYESVTISETSFYDKMKFSLYDIQDRKELARRFVQRSDKNDQFLRAFFDKYYKKVEKNNEETKSEDNYRKLLADYDEVENKLKSSQKEYAENCITKDCSPQEKQRLEKEIEKNKKDLEKANEQIANPPTVLLKLILNVLNNAIEDEAQLNLEQDLNPKSRSTRTEFLSKVKANDEATIKLLNRLWVEDLFYDELERIHESDFPTEFYNLGQARSIGNLNNVDNRMVRTTEIIPRQSSLNVNDVKIRNKSSVLNFIVSTLFGLGANFNYQQQRERYSQFVQQELYSSGFGKGAREFGWTFTSMPGTDRLLSGTRNTYAVVVVPQEATTIALESIGCSFDRTARQPENFQNAVDKHKKECTEQKSFVIPIPGGGFGSNNDFYVSGMTFEPVEKGKRIVFSIHGSNFSSQIGILVNGIPLLPSIGIAQNFIRDDSEVAKEVLKDFKTEKIRGNFERVDSNQIIASFELVDGDNGTPVITLISPGKAVDLNSLRLYINGVNNIKLNQADWMFGKKPSTDFKVDDTQIFVSKTDDKTGEITELTALITGNSFGNISNVFVNGLDPAECAVALKDDNSCPNNNTIGKRGYWGQFNVYRITFPPPKDEKIQIVMVRGTDVLKLNPISNPAKSKKPKDPPTLNPSELSFSIKQVTPFYADDKKTKISYILVEITGKGLNSSLETSLGQLDVESETRAFITIQDPRPAQTIKITDNKKNIYAVGVVEISEIVKPTPQKTPTPAPSP